MQLEVGKYYVDREGHTHGPMRLVPSPEMDTVFISARYCWSDSQPGALSTVCAWQLNGRWSSSGADKRDLISEVTTPTKEEEPIDYVSPNEFVINRVDDRERLLMRGHIYPVFSREPGTGNVVVFDWNNDLITLMLGQYADINAESTIIRITHTEDPWAVPEGALFRVRKYGGEVAFKIKDIDGNDDMIHVDHCEIVYQVGLQRVASEWLANKAMPTMSVEERETSRLRAEIASMEQRKGYLARDIRNLVENERELRSLVQSLERRIAELKEELPTIMVASKRNLQL